MKNFLTSLIFSSFCYLVNAQDTHFIYLQTENKQPFFVKLNNKTLNSYPSGYLIIPNLEDGLYSLVIGFPEGGSEQEYNCSVRNKDVGFIIKNTGGQWQLLNVQTLNVIVPGDVITKPVINYEKETDPFSTMLANAVNDSTILRKDVAREIISEKASEVNIKDTAHSSVAGNTTVSEIKDSTQTAVAKTDNSLKEDSAKKNIAKQIIPEQIIDSSKKDTAVTVNPNDVVISKPDNISKTDSTIHNDVTIIPAEKPGEVIQKDTVQAVPLNDIAATKSKKKKSKKDQNALQDSTLTQKEITQVIPEKVGENKDSQAINSNNELALLRSAIKRKLKRTSKDGIEMMYVDDTGESKDTIRILIPSDKKQKKDDEINSAPIVTVPVSEPGNRANEAAGKKKSDYKISRQEKEIIKEASKEPVFISTMINSDCKSVATDDDFLKIRKKMVAENNDEDMIKAARKIFKTKCFTTEQIKNLSVLFLKDEGKYMFFDAAYSFASDSDQYSTLENQLTDNYYITRFRAMIHK